MKTQRTLSRRFLSLLLTLVMALAMAVPAFADPSGVLTGDVYEYDASGLTAITGSAADLTVLGVAVQVDPSTEATLPAQLAVWAAGATITGWSVSVDGTTDTLIILTATADDAVIPTGATVKTLVERTNKIEDLAGLTTGNKTEISTDTKVPTIDVVIPATGNAVLNPYQLTVNVNGANKTAQVISAMQYVKSASDVPLKVSVNAKATVPTGMTLATKTAVAATTKQAYLWLNTVVANESASAPVEASLTWPATPVAKTGVVLTAAAAGVNVANIELAKGDTNPSYLAFRLEGDMAKAPTTPWAATDKVGVTLAFTFVASANAVSGT